MRYTGHPLTAPRLPLSQHMLIAGGYTDEKPSYSNFFVNSQTWIMLDLGRNVVFLKVILFYSASSMLMLKPWYSEAAHPLPSTSD